MPKAILFKQWENSDNPKRILFIRLQALGDTIITFPYIQGFKKQHPGLQIDFLTRAEWAGTAECLELFDSVHVLKGGRKTWRQALNAFLWTLSKNDYDIVVDLQNNWISRLVRKRLSPKAWSKFDCFSPISAGQRTSDAINRIGLGLVQPHFSLRLKNQNLGNQLLQQHGWYPDQELVVLNPAGFFKTRNWPIANYLKFAEMWLDQFENTRFLVIGIDRIQQKANYLKEKLGDKLINLVGLTTPEEAFAIIQKVKLVVTEDSGLMHMAWVSGKATLALFGSSRSDWSRPLGEQSKCLNSSDLACGECMQPQCKFGDIRCLTRYTPEMVLGESLKLIESS